MREREREREKEKSARTWERVLSLLFNMLSRYMCLDRDKSVTNNYTYNILLMDSQCKNI